MLKSFIRRLGKDLIFSVAAMVALNGCIQFLLYPYLTRQMGAESFGVVIYLLAVISVMGSFGSGANYSRMVVSAGGEYSNGDYNRFFVIVSLISAAVSATALVALKSFSPAYYAGYTLLMILTVLRYYGDVEFRQTCNFKGYFVYYVLVAAGYCAGVLLYPLTRSWLVSMALGEAAALIFVTIRGRIFTPPLFKKSAAYKENTKSVWQLTAANLVHAAVLNADRILIIFFIGTFEVTVFYAANLIGKTAALLTVPLEGIVISYLNKYEGKLTYKLFAEVSAALAALAVVLTALSALASHILIPILYPEVFDRAKAYFVAANAGQILFFISTVLITFILKISGEKSQLKINIIYLIAFFAVTVPCTAFGGLTGLAAGIAAVNAARFILIAVCGGRMLKAGERRLLDNPEKL